MPITSSTWTTPITWTPSLAITVARLNEFIGAGGDLQYAADVANYAYNGRSLINAFVVPTTPYLNNTASSPYTAVDNTNLNFSLNVNSGRVQGLWAFMASCTDSTGSPVGMITTLGAGIAYDGNTTGAATMALTKTASTVPVVVPFGFTTLGGTVSIELMWRIINGGLPALSICPNNASGSAFQGIRLLAWEI